MTRVSSTMLPLGTQAPAFSLPDLDGKIISLDDWKNAKGYLVMFMCNHCPFVVHVRHELSKIGKEYQNKGVAVVAINSNDVANYPDDSPEKMKIFAAENEFTFPYLYDESQNTAKAYHAACTPDFFLFDREKKLVYRGQLDDGRPGNEKPVDGRDLRAALDAVIAGTPVPAEQKPSMGCNIKWKYGHEPS
ncbi:MAG: thioredoxin family protein [Candidatus Hinthialibacter sp.]